MKELLDFLRAVIDEFTDVIKEIIMPRTFFCLMFYGTFCYMTLKGAPVPDTLKDVVFSLLGYWFGSRIGSGQKVNGFEPNGNGDQKK